MFLENVLEKEIVVSAILHCMGLVGQTISAVPAQYYYIELLKEGLVHQSQLNDYP